MRSIDELDEELRTLQAEAEGGPFIVELVVPDAGTLAMGVGAVETVLSYTAASGDPPYFRTAGPREHGDDLVFFYFGDWTDFHVDHAVPVAQGFDAMRHFFTHRTLSPNLEWKEV